MCGGVLVELGVGPLSSVWCYVGVGQLCSVWRNAAGVPIGQCMEECYSLFKCAY